MKQLNKFYFDLETKLKNKPLKFYLFLLVIALVL